MVIMSKRVQASQLSPTDLSAYLFLYNVKAQIYIT